LSTATVCLVSGAILSLRPADAVDVSAATELDVGAGQPDYLGDAQAGLNGAEQQGVVPPAGPGRPVRTVQQRLGLVWVQERDGPSLAALGRDREHACDQSGVLGMPERAVLEERVDRPEPHVAGTGAVPTLGLQVIEERADHRRVELRELELRRSGAGSLLSKAWHEQQSGVSVG
jgi:hypothetical protein